jgi:hypothetical protein
VFLVNIAVISEYKNINELTDQGPYATSHCASSTNFTTKI